MFLDGELAERRPWGHQRHDFKCPVTTATGQESTEAGSRGLSTRPSLFLAGSDEALQQPHRPFTCPSLCAELRPLLNGKCEDGESGKEKSELRDELIKVELAQLGDSGRRNISLIQAQLKNSLLKLHSSCDDAIVPLCQYASFRLILR
ncbi:hypothetical protein AOLI_G00213610 [Acnodon oligacanthus]